MKQLQKAIDNFCPRILLYLLVKKLSYRGVRKQRFKKWRQWWWRWWCWLFCSRRSTYRLKLIITHSQSHIQSTANEEEEAKKFVVLPFAKLYFISLLITVCVCYSSSLYNIEKDHRRNSLNSTTAPAYK